VRAVLLLLLVGCPRRVPDHLALTPAEKAPPVGGDDGMESLLDGDPLARQVRLPTSRSKHAAVASFQLVISEIESGQLEPDSSLQRLEENSRGTEAVALSRGYRLRRAERLLFSENEEDQRLVALGVTSFTSSATQVPFPLSPLAWLGETAARDFGEQWTLKAWLDGPEIDVQPAAEALQAEQFSHLSRHAFGRMIQSRAFHTNSGSSGAIDWMERAGTAALTRVSADRDHEQAAWADQRSALREELNTDEPPDIFMLKRARATMSFDCSTDKACATALAAEAALAWRTGCNGDQTCIGTLDTLNSSERFGGPYSHIWRVVALKEAIDSMDAGHDTVMFHRAMLRLVEAIGTGKRPLHLVRRKQAAPEVWLAVGRMLGTDGVTTWEDTHQLLGQRLQVLCDKALATDLRPEQQNAIQKIRSRAIP
jgi:hypothetical protein